MIIRRNRDGSYSAFQRIGEITIIAEGWTRMEALVEMLQMLRQQRDDNGKL